MRDKLGALLAHLLMATCAYLANSLCVCVSFPNGHAAFCLHFCVKAVQEDRLLREGQKAQTARRRVGGWGLGAPGCNP